MFSTKKKVAAAVSLGFAGLLVLSGCSMGSGSTSPSSSSAPSSGASSTAPATMDPSADLIGPGCAAYAKAVPDGAGSIQGMSQDPLAVAASNDPMIKTLMAAVSGKLSPDVNLVNTLDGSEFTVFATVDDAFAKIPASTIDGLKTDSKTLTSILTYHVVAGQTDPSKIAGTHKTVEGADLTVTGSGDNLMVGDAKVICGGVHTANATVYLIDAVLMPPAQ
ncbi:MAG: fasciclin domain-containing protein [Actinobacteria bacterium]|nr:fasciclin domain-containing protein [Actinomycetota bacterium]